MSAARRARVGAVLALAITVVGACGRSGPLPPPPARVASASPEWWNGAVVYEVFVRSFQDSGSDGNGDLAGVASRLDYLSDLGVDAVWLMPIFPSPSSHGYDVTDYDAVNPDYGSMSDLDALVAAAHARGIKVVLDWVPNHTSVRHPWFVDAASSGAAARRDWYVWRGTDPGWGQPWNARGKTWYPAGDAYYYAVFWDGMPDLNWNNAEVRDAIAAAAARWVTQHGVDGFRLDAVRYLVESGPGPGQEDQPATHGDLEAFAASVRAASLGAGKADPLIVGEAWADTATIATYVGTMTAALPGGDELPLTFDFPLADAIVRGVGSGSAQPIADALDAVARTYPAGAGDAPFLTNHDQERVASRLGGIVEREKLAAAILLTLQGTPFVYYGEEIGLLNGSCSSDECKRTPMAWDASATGGFTAGTPWWPLSAGTSTSNVAAQVGDAGSLLSRYRTLIRLRKASPALARGGTTRLDAEGSVLGYLRTGASERVLVVHGVGTNAQAVTFAFPGSAAEPMLVDAGVSITPSSSGKWLVRVPPCGTGIWRIAP